ncbi:hypothetical protein PIB30_053696 [Stylosanthes scabra]|uniref:Uncharacterized protein n=1 Tax=Stylosanthes scabra TaxID=79078 RepID=A0ABU6XGC1_9FABA|nr:hypothetical protein [Stylosanthes scabra]
MPCINIYESPSPFVTSFFISNKCRIFPGVVSPFRKHPVRVTVPNSTAKSDRRTFTLNLPRNTVDEPIWVTEKPC